MDLFLIRVDGLDVAITDSASAAHIHAWSLASNDLSTEVRVLRVKDDSILQMIPSIPVAEAATA